MSPEEKKALDRYINATEQRVAQWAPAQREACRKATRSAPRDAPEPQEQTDPPPSR